MTDHQDPRRAPDGSPGDAGTTELSVVCRDCGDAIHVDLEVYVEGAEVACPECGTGRDLEAVDDALASREILLDRPPEEARGSPTILSEFPSPG